MSSASIRLRIAFVTACVASAPLMACKGPTEAGTPASDALEEMTADLITFGMVSFLTSKGVREGRIEADTAYAYEDSSTIRLVGMHVVFYAEDGRERATVVADGGELDQRTSRMVARGNVVLTVRDDGRKVESPELNYDPDRDRIWSDSATVLTRADGRVTRGSSFESDLQFNNIEIANPRGAIGEIVF